jgi:hypothetical protein
LRGFTIAICTVFGTQRNGAQAVGFRRWRVVERRSRTRTNEF